MSAPTPRIQTRRLTLRALQTHDRQEYLRVHEIGRDFFAAWSPRPGAPVSLEERFADELARSWAGELNPHEARFVAVLPDGRHAAYVSLSQIFRRAFMNCVIGWKANPELLNQGYATEAVTAMLDFAFSPDGLGLHRVQAAIIPANGPSLRVAEKCGFRREGLALRYLQIAGEWQDHILLAKVVDEHTVTSIVANA